MRAGGEARLRAEWAEREPGQRFQGTTTVHRVTPSS
jgi:hypothetical protein